MIDDLTDGTLQPGRSAAKTERIALGLAILSAVAEPGACFTLDEIAIWAGCERKTIAEAERRALQKLRKHFTAPEFLLILRGQDSGRQKIINHKS